MKREILFKIKVILTNEGKEFYNRQSEFIESVIHNVVSLDLVHNQCVIHDKKKESVITVFESYCETYELMQFTGLLDKNGVKIFEGDLLHTAGYYCEVKFIDAMFCSVYNHPEDGETLPLVDLSPERFEIIGNIHDSNDKN